MGLLDMVTVTQVAETYHNNSVTAHEEQGLHVAELGLLNVQLGKHTQRRRVMAMTCHPLSLGVEQWQDAAVGLFPGQQHPSIGRFYNELWCAF